MPLTLYMQVLVWGSAVSSASGLWGRASTEIDFRPF